ncbi:MAG: phosphate acyltransferase PlsX [Coriobacteriales bacterium]|jgi:glycerol-3-phosphate acyltransferase PlsX|nr:phosphate acyltransferase PlsX [Coriobacteriales bacterium]
MSNAANPAFGHGHTTPVTVAVDALGGDKAPDVVCAGARAALEADPFLSLVLTGHEEVVVPFAQEQPARVTAFSTTEAIGMDEHPATAVKAKRDSSIVVACRLVKEGSADAFFSAGSTGACMAAATLVIGRAKGVSRPAIAAVIPAPAAPVVLADVGANADVKPEYLLQFAHMACAYAKAVLNVSEPRCALLNIGSEEAKGSALAQEAHLLLARELEGFAGNAEGDDVFSGRFDCIVTDGFTGNILLKAIEGTAGALFAQLKSVFTSSLSAKLGACLVKSRLSVLKETMSAEKYGGAPLLGLKAPVVIGHGSSSATAIANGIHATAEMVRAGLAGRVADAISASELTAPSAVAAIGGTFSVL